MKKNSIVNWDGFWNQRAKGFDLLENSNENSKCSRSFLGHGNGSEKRTSMKQSLHLGILLTNLFF